MIAAGGCFQKENKFPNPGNEFRLFKTKRAIFSDSPHHQKTTLCKSLKEVSVIF
jgi:hypothetical protein